MMMMMIMIRSPSKGSADASSAYSMTPHDQISERPALYLIIIIIITIIIITTIIII